MSTLKAINLQHPSSANNNIVLDSGGNANFANNLVVTGSLTIAGISNLPYSNGVSVDTTSGATIDFTGIPTNAKKIYVINTGLAMSNADSMKVQVGVNGTPVTSGYYGAYSGFSITGNSSTWASSSFFVPLNARYGVDSLFMIINTGGNEWIGTGSGSCYLNSAATYASVGNVSLSGPINMIRITANSTGQFINGKMTVAWET